VIDKLSLFQGESVIKTKKEEDIVLKNVVESWIPKSKDPEEIEEEGQEDV